MQKNGKKLKKISRSAARTFGTTASECVICIIMKIGTRTNSAENWTEAGNVASAAGASNI